MIRGIEPLEIPSRRFANLVWYKLHDGLDEEGKDLMTKEIEKAALSVRHPLHRLFMERSVVPSAPTEPVKRERRPPPGWKSEKESFANAMALMNFAGRGRR